MYDSICILLRNSPICMYYITSIVTDSKCPTLNVEIPRLLENLGKKSNNDAVKETLLSLILHLVEFNPKIYPIDPSNTF